MYIYIYIWMFNVFRQANVGSQVLICNRPHDEVVLVASVPPLGFVIYTVRADPEIPALVLVTVLLATPRLNPTGTDKVLTGMSFWCPFQHQVVSARLH